MAVLIVEPHDGYATWLANALSGLTDRVVRAANPDEAMAAVAAEGRDVLAAILGPSLADRDALALAGALQQGTPDISVLLVRRQESGELIRQALRVGVKDVLSSASDKTAIRTATARAIEIARTLRGRLGGERPPTPARAGPRQGRHRLQLQGRLRQDVPLDQPGRRPQPGRRRGGPGRPRPPLRRRGHHAAPVPDPHHLRRHPEPRARRADAEVVPDPPRLRDLDAGRPDRADHRRHHQPGAIGTILKLLRSAFDYVVIDTPPAFSEPVLAAFDESDWLVMLATLDVPSIKNLRLTLQTMELLHFPKNRIRVVVNRADSKVGLRLPDVEKLLSSPVDATIPSSRSVPLSVNKGSPIMLEEPKGPVAESIRRVAAQLVERDQAGRPKQKQRRSLFARS